MPSTSTADQGPVEALLSPAAQSCRLDMGEVETNDAATLTENLYRSRAQKDPVDRAVNGARRKIYDERPLERWPGPDPG